MTEMTEEQIKEIAEEAATKAVKRMLLVLGVNADVPESLFELQADLAHTRKWRKSTERVVRVGLGTAVGTLVSGLLAIVWLGIQAKFGK